jgi:replicative superfamily II helicase
MTSQEERDRLKEEYKAHYRSIQDTRKKPAESERVAKIAKTLRDMNADHLLE